MRDGEPDANFIRVAGRSFSDYSEEGDLFVELARDYFREVKEAFRRALAEALPRLEADELDWRFHFTVCSMLAVLANHGRYEQFLLRGVDSGDIPAMLRRLRDFLAGGLQGPVSHNPLGSLT